MPSLFMDEMFGGPSGPQLHALTFGFVPSLLSLRCVCIAKDFPHLHPQHHNTD